MLEKVTHYFAQLIGEELLVLGGWLFTNVGPRLDPKRARVCARARYPPTRYVAGRACRMPDEATTGDSASFRMTAGWRACVVMLA